MVDEIKNGIYKNGSNELRASALRFALFLFFIFSFQTNYVSFLVHDFYSFTNLDKSYYYLIRKSQKIYYKNFENLR